MALRLLINETYFLEDAYYCRPLIQYVCVILCHKLGCNIIDVANQLSFAYKGLAPNFRVFITPSIDTTKATDFIQALEEK